MTLLGGKAEPGKQSVIDYETALLQRVVVIARECRQAQRNRVKSGCFRSDIRPCGVGTTHDQSEPCQRGFALQPEELEHGVE